MIISIIGTAGRDRARRHHITREIYSRMLRAVENTVQQHCPAVEDRIYQSGGAALSDHVAVSALHRGACGALRLHLPAQFLLDQNQYEDTGFKSPGSTSNYYHGLFSRQMGVDTLESLGRAIRDPRTTTQVYPGFFARNIPVGKCDLMVALTWAHGLEPADGGTAHTWSSSSCPLKVHLSLQDLL